MTQNICFVSLSVYGYFDTSAPIGGGAERQLFLLSQELTEEFKLSFVVGDFGQDTVETVDGITLYRSYRRNPSASLFERVGHLVKLYRAMKRADADVYVYRGHPRKAAVTYLISRILGRKWVYNLASDSNIDTETLTYPFDWLFERAVRRADDIITQTEYQQTSLEERFGRSSVVVPNGYPPASDPIPYEERTHVLWVGRLGVEKRPHLFLDLAEELTTVSFRLVGMPGNDTEYNETIRNRVTELENVDLFENVPPDDVHEHYRSAIAVVNTSKYEGFPNTFLEAWRQGTPVVSLDVDIGRYITVTPSGYCDGSWSSFVQTVQQLAFNPEKRRSYGKPARELFEQNFTIASTAHEYADVLLDT